jgi:hypothetical protein
LVAKHGPKFCNGVKPNGEPKCNDNLYAHGYSSE